MNRIQLACYSLIASAFILAALLIVQLGDRHGSGLTSPALGGQVIARENFTLLTARSRDNEEALFILENTTGRLLIYRFDPGRNRIELAGGVNMAQVFDRAADAGDRRRGRN